MVKNYLSLVIVFFFYNAIYSQVSAKRLFFWQNIKIISKAKQVDSVYVTFKAKRKLNADSITLSQIYCIPSLNSKIVFYMNNIGELDSLKSEQEKVVSTRISDSSYYKYIVLKNWGLNQCNISYSSVFTTYNNNFNRKIILSEDQRFRQYISKGANQDTVLTQFLNIDYKLDSIHEPKIRDCNFYEHYFFDWIEPGTVSKSITFKTKDIIDSVVYSFSQFKGYSTMINKYDSMGRLSVITSYNINSNNRNRVYKQFIYYKKNGEVKKTIFYINPNNYYSIKRKRANVYIVNFTKLEGENLFLNNVRIKYYLFIRESKG